MKKYMLLLIPLLGIIAFLISPAESAAAGKNALDYCLSSIVPALFPFFVFSSLAVSLGFAEILGKPLDKFMRSIFKLPGSCAPVFVLGLLSGFPVGAKTAADLYSSSLCQKKDAENLLAFCNNAGPAFVVGVVGAGLWGDAFYGWIFFAIQTFSSIIVGIFFCRFGNNTAKTEFVYPSFRSKKFLVALVDSVTKSALSLLYVSAFIVFFSVIISMLFSFEIIPSVASFFSFLAPKNQIENILAGIIEFSEGVVRVCSDDKAAFKTLTAATAAKTAFILGWSGLSVHCQIASVVSECGLSLKRYFAAKSLSAIFSSVLTFAIFYIILT